MIATYVIETMGTQEYKFTPTEFLARFEESFGSAAAQEIAPHLAA
jgi:adenosine kinase